MIFFGVEKLSWLPSKNKVADEGLHFQRYTNLLVKLQCSDFSSSNLFLEGNQLIFSSPKNSSNESRLNPIHMMLQTPKVLCRFDINI